MQDRKILKNIASRLNRHTYDDFAEYPFSEELQGIMDDAEEQGVVIVYGLSDDLVEFDGAFKEEAGCFEGGNITFDENGTSDDGYAHVNKLQVRWMKDYDEDNRVISFSYILGIPHETFMVYEDDYPYCRGLVFFASDMRKPNN